MVTGDARTAAVAFEEGWVGQHFRRMVGVRWVLVCILCLPCL